MSNSRDPEILIGKLAMTLAGCLMELGVEHEKVAVHADEDVYDFAHRILDVHAGKE